MTLVYVPKKNVGMKSSPAVHTTTMKEFHALCDRDGTSQLLPLLGKCSLYKTVCTEDALLLLGGEGGMF